MKFNHQLYSKIYSLRKDNRDYYCFPLRRFLGPNGLFENHPLKGAIFEDIETRVRYSVDDVYVHWWNGWYYMALARNSENSHGAITWNINSTLTDWSINNYKKIEDGLL